MERNNQMYVKLKAGIKGIFQSVYVYIDSDRLNALHLFREIGLKVTIKEGMKPIDDSERLNMYFIYVPRKRAADFEKCMEVHKRNSILLGWGNTDQCRRMIEDMHRCAES